MIRAQELALVQGMDHTRKTLRGWQPRPFRVLGPWTAWSLLVALGLLAATFVVAELSPPDLTPLAFPGLHFPADLGDYGIVLFRNGLVLALHALACVAGFMAGSSLPVVARGYTGWKRWIHEKAGPLAIVFVTCATLFSLVTQAYILGQDTSTLAGQLDVSPLVLLSTLSLHAIPELTALFLPLAAWTLAARREAWNELLAATFVTVAVAVPVLLVSAAVEVWWTPLLLRQL